MKKVIIAINGIIALLFGVVAIQLTYGGQELGPLYFIQLIPWLIALLFTLMSLLLSISDYRVSKKIWAFMLPVSGLFLCVMAGMRILEMRAIDHSKTIYSIENVSGAQKVMNFDFKANEKFKVVVTELFSQTAYYGKYTMRGDTLQIVSSNFKNDQISLPNVGIILRDTIFWNNFDTMIVESIPGQPRSLK